MRWSSGGVIPSSAVVTRPVKTGLSAKIPRRDRRQSGTKKHGDRRRQGVLSGQPPPHQTGLLITTPPSPPPAPTPDPRAASPGPGTPRESAPSRRSSPPSQPRSAARSRRRGRETLLEVQPPFSLDSDRASRGRSGKKLAALGSSGNARLRRQALEPRRQARGGLGLCFRTRFRPRPASGLSHAGWAPSRSPGGPGVGVR